MKNFKTIFDYCAAIILLIVLALPIILAWLIASIETGQNGLFIQQRIGKHGNPFYIYKIRTMRGASDNPITTENSHYITTSGKYFIKYKIDEFPQLFNILNGTMSLVGPRPDVPGYADRLKGDDRIILSVKPGITGPAQLKYRNELELLSQSDNPKELNDNVLWPDKVAINRKYVQEWSFKKDLKVLLVTLFS